MFKAGILTAGLIAIVTSANADPETAKQRLAEAQEALKNAQSLTFTLKVEAKGMISVKVDGTVKMMRQEKTGGKWIARLIGDSVLAMGMGDDDAAKVPYDIVIDGDYYTWIDHENKRVMQRVGKGARDRQITVAKQYAWVRDLATADPFHLGDKSYETIDLTGQETIGGVECDVIVLDEGQNKTKQTWYIATSDNLPRQLHRKMGGMLDNKYTMTSLKANSEQDAATYKIATPEGYKDDKLGNQPAQNLAQGISPAPINNSLTRQASAFELLDTDGNSVMLSDLKGQVVVLEFLLTYSGVSRHSAPEMKSFLEDVADKPVKVFTLPMKERSRDKTTGYFTKHELSQTVLHDGDDVAASYMVRKFPAYVVIDAEGSIAYETGYIKNESFDSILAEIDKLLNPGGEDGDTSEGGSESSDSE